MNAQSTTAIILAAGLGTRMKSNLPKVMHPVAGRPMIKHLIATLNAVSTDRCVVVIGDEMDGLADTVAPHATAIQKDRLGTGHAVLAAREALGEITGTALVVYGDSPLIKASTLETMLAARKVPNPPAVVVLGFRPADPAPYGRLITNARDELEAIVEAKEATPEQLAITLCNSGVMVIDAERLWSMLDRIDSKNAKGEYYLTDLVAVARQDGLSCAYVEGSESEMLGVNSRIELAGAEAIIQKQLRDKAMAGGATLIAPDTVTFSFDTTLGRDVVVEPNVFFGPGVHVGDNVTIKAFSHLEGCQVKNNAILGPYARLRPGAAIGESARVGNFVEIKNAELGTGAKANHLSYIGDSSVGAHANIGAGTITCNYDGFNKSRTTIGEGAFIGSNTALVAPVRVGDGAIIGAGSTITKDVEADSLSVTRAPQKSVTGWAAKFRRAMQNKKLNKS